MMLCGAVPCDCNLHSSQYVQNIWGTEHDSKTKMKQTEHTENTEFNSTTCDRNQTKKKTHYKQVTTSHAQHKWFGSRLESHCDLWHGICMRRSDKSQPVGCSEIKIFQEMTNCKMYNSSQTYTGYVSAIGLAAIRIYRFSDQIPIFPFS